MILVSLLAGGHEWEKMNLVTKMDRNGMYDRFRCKCCGIEGKSYQMGMITIPERYRKNAFHCPNEQIHRKVKVVRCNAGGGQFANLTPGSIHDIVETPQSERLKGGNKRGEWVMGVSEPVLLVFGEFTYID